MAKKKKETTPEFFENSEETSGSSTKKASESDPDSEDDRDMAIAALFKAANKNFGANSLITSDENQFKDYMRIPTGVFPLDYALGGGIPVGRITMFYGHKSTSKTTSFLRAVGNAQKRCSDCWTIKKSAESSASCACGKNRKVIVAWLDVEGVWDHAWASNFLKVDETILLSQPSSAEQAIDLAHAALRSQVDIIVIDSIAFMQPQAEQDRSSQDQLVGTQARLVGVGIRKFVSTINDIGKTSGRRPTVLLTNQIRMKVGVMFGSPETTSGGLAAGFSTSVEVKTGVGKYEMDEVTGKPLSVELKAKVEKNKTFSPKIEAEWKMVLMKTDMKNVGESIDEHWALDMAEKAGLVQVAPQKVEWNGQLFRGKSLLEKHWMESKSDYEVLRSQLMPILLAV